MPCGNARLAPLRPGECPRCWIAIHDGKPRPARDKLKPKVKQLLVIRPDRCDHFTGPTRTRACAGWRRAGNCSLGLAAVPGIFCQTCPSYVIDPDYEGQGVIGWIR